MYACQATTSTELIQVDDIVMSQIVYVSKYRMCINWTYTNDVYNIICLKILTNVGKIHGYGTHSL